MKLSDEAAKAVFEHNPLLRESAIQKLKNDFSHFLFRLNRKFNRRKVDFHKLIPQGHGFDDSKIVEVIIPIYGESALLGQCLDSISKSQGINAQVTIVDNGVPIQIKELIKRHDCVVNIIENETNKGFGGACNIGLQSATTDFPILLNSDVILNPDTLRHLVDEMETHPKLGTCSAVLVNEFGRFEEAGRVLTKQGNSIALKGTKKFKTSARTGIDIVPYASFACVAIRKSVFDRTAGFDELFFPAYSEDLDLAIEFFKLGFVSSVCLQSYALHFQGNATKELLNLTEIKERNRIKLLNKHESFFALVPDVRHDETHTYRLKRAVCFNRDSVLVLTFNTNITSLYIAELLGCGVDDLITKFISVIAIDSDNRPIEIKGSSKSELEQNAIEYYSTEESSLKVWFRNRIGVYDSFIVAGTKELETKGELFELLKASQPQISVENMPAD